MLALAEIATSVVMLIMSIFGHHHGPKAVDVAWCESRYHTTARNGQYLGIFQMGSWERRNYAHGRYTTARHQILAAHRYWLRVGWGAWSCA